MRIILVHNNFSTQGGAEVFYHEVGRVLEKNGHKVAYFSVAESECSSPWAEYFPEAVEYKRGSLVSTLSRFTSMIYSKDAKYKLGELIRFFKPDIIHTFAIYTKLTPSVLDACSEFEIPVVMSCNDYKHICPSYKLYHHGKICEECKGGRFYRAIVNRCSHDSLIYSTAVALEAYAHSYINIYRKNIHTFLFSSNFMAQKTEEFWGKGSFRWRLLKNPFNSQAYNQSFSPEGSVLFFGRLIEEKGLVNLVKAASLLPDIDFRIVGDGPDKEWLQEYSQDLGCKNITFVGPKWGEDIDVEIQSCRFVVVPSVWHENFPYVINQSFAFGKPVIGSNRGGITELVSNGERGIIYEATDSDALAQSIKRLWSDPECVKSMGKAAKTYSDKQFNDVTFYETLISIYREVIE